MTDELNLRRKWTLRAHGKQVVFVKRPVESTQHVLMKAFLWALYLPQYPDMLVEVPIGGRYKPDLISLAPGSAVLGDEGRPRFWGECGHVGLDKLRTLLRKHKDTHFAFARWAQPMHHALEHVNNALREARRNAPVDVLVFPHDAAERFIREQGQVSVTLEDIQWRRL